MTGPNKPDASLGSLNIEGVTGSTIGTGDINITTQAEGDIVGRDKITNIYHYSSPQPVDEATLAAAQALLASLPTGRVPDPAP